MPKISEDTIVAGYLIGLPLWLFVGLPLFDWLSNMDQQQQQSVTMQLAPWVNVLIGFLGGSVMSLLLGGFSSWWKRPILSARLVQGMGCYVTTSRGNPRTHDAHFLRLLIENKGWSTIKDCRGYLVRITRIVNGNRLGSQQEVLGLEWSSGPPNEPHSLPRGAFFYMNVASLELSGPPHYLQLAVDWRPNHLPTVFQAPATFELAIKVAAENAAPIDRVVRFEFDPQWQDLDFQFD